MRTMLNVPESDAVVDVRVIDTYVILNPPQTVSGKALIRMNPDLLLVPGKTPYFQSYDAPMYSFLISNDARHIIFDLGVRRDTENLAPSVRTMMKATTVITPGSDVASVLDDDDSGLGIRSKHIEAVIWSHTHFDHTGDPATFPPSTELIVGPGVKQASWPGWPSNPQADILDSDVAGRNVREINFEDPDASGIIRVGQFVGFDYFGDGSFYLLDAPGHTPGHICGLARVQSSPESTFVLMGADACHHPGVLRPSLQFPLPDSVPLLQAPVPCPGELLLQLTLQKNATSAFFTLPNNAMFPDHEAALTTVQKIQQFEVSGDVFVIIAHDHSIKEHIPLFPQTLNDWKEKDLHTKTRWKFCGDFHLAEGS